MPARLQRLLAPDGRCFDVAIDHGVFNEATFLIQHPDPTAMTRAFMAMVYDGATPEQAMAILRGVA
jgi:DhnA family fructose-bisphosphate aldolase class Ia